MFKNFLMIIFSMILAISACGQESINSGGDKLLVINQFMSHPALDAVAQGVEEALRKRAAKVKIQLQNAQGNITNTVQIAKHQASQSPEVIVAIATPSVQSVAKARTNVKKTIIAFAAVTDPVAAGISKLENIIGVVDTPPINDLIDILLKALPDKKRVGIISNSGEINSIKIAEQFISYSTAKGLRVINMQISIGAQVKAAAEKLVSEVDVIFIPQDNIVVSAIDSVIQVAASQKVPVIGNDPSLVDKGLLFALGCDYFKIGVQLGDMIADRLENKKVEPNIQGSGIKEFRINEKMAVILGLDSQILKGASK